MAAKFAVFDGKSRRVPLANAFFSRLLVDKHGNATGQTPLSAAPQAGFPHIYFVTLGSPAIIVLIDAPGYRQQLRQTVQDGDEYEIHLDAFT